MKNLFAALMAVVVGLSLGACAPYQSRPQFQQLAGVTADGTAVYVAERRNGGLIEAVISAPQKILFGSRENYTEAIVVAPGGAVAVQSSTGGGYRGYPYGGLPVASGGMVPVPGSGIWVPNIGLPGQNTGYHAPSFNGHIGSRGWGVRVGY